MRNIVAILDFFDLLFAQHYVAYVVVKKIFFLRQTNSLSFPDTLVIFSKFPEFSSYFGHFFSKFPEFSLSGRSKKIFSVRFLEWLETMLFGLLLIDWLVILHHTQGLSQEDPFAITMNSQLWEWCFMLNTSEENMRLHTMAAYYRVDELYTSRFSALWNLYIAS